MWIKLKKKDKDSLVKKIFFKRQQIMHLNSQTIKYE